MPATSEAAIKRKMDNRLSKKDMGRETKIAELGGTALAISYGQPLSQEDRLQRLGYLYDLMYPSRTVFVSSGKTKQTEAERKEKARILAKERYRREKLSLGNDVRAKAPNGTRQIYSPWYRLWAGAKARSEKKNLPFTIQPTDVYDLVADLEVCPVLGIPLCWTNDKMKDDSPTLDRMVPSLGYVVGNIAVISQKANRIKTDANSEELGKVYSWMKRQGL
jgi:hypothetical protein